MAAIDKRLEAAIEAYLRDPAQRSEELQHQIDFDLNLVERCFLASLKFPRDVGTIEEHAESVAFEVLSHYSASLRRKIAERLCNRARDEGLIN